MKKRGLFVVLLCGDIGILKFLRRFIDMGCGGSLLDEFKVCFCMNGVFCVVDCYWLNICFVVYFKKIYCGIVLLIIKERLVVFGY